MGDRPSLSIFFPCYNDAGTIGALVASADGIAREVTDDYEVIVIDDGSTDGSRTLLSRLRERFTRLKVILHDRNRGYGGALRSGFSCAGKDLVFYTDGDGQYDVGELPILLERLQDGVDVVNGYKVRRSDPWYRKAIGGAYLRLMRALFDVKVRDINCDFRLIRRETLDGVRLDYDSGAICVELVVKLERSGARFVEVPVAHYPRRYGKSQFFSLRRVIQTWQDVRRLRRRMMASDGGRPGGGV